MASFKEHVGFSGLLGVGYGLAATFMFGFQPTQAALAGYLAGVGGMLPDLDSPTGKPGQEIFSLTAAVVPLVLIGYVLKWAGLPTDTETVMLTLLLMYFAIRYGGSWLVAKLCVHRGMFHSIPAMLISAEATYLFYPSDELSVKILMSGAVTIGFFSHLLLDEIYSVGWSGPVPKLKKSFGTALKLYGTKFGPAAFAYALLAFMTFVTLEDAGVIGPPEPRQATSPSGEETEDAEDQLDFQQSSEALPLQSASRAADELTDAPRFQTQ
ncbi:metal-dependent hydrolase [Thalassoglobus sp. JC818]|uniref:metal-dependent hydrolase n=1 Tax=Thalassoglobus sp. JC818 TaxID=3232136 RepID=UPI0034573E96